jgi:hypothetical protein
MSRALCRSLVPDTSAGDSPLQVLEVKNPFSCWGAADDNNSAAAPRRAGKVQSVEVEVDGDSPQPLCDRVLAAVQGPPGQHTVLVMGAQQAFTKSASTRY